MRVKPTSTLSLLKRIEAKRFEHAVFLTYSLDLPFFEESVLRHLLRRECRNVAIFADHAHAAAELLSMAKSSASRSAWPCGRLYSLTPVFHHGSFHPKVAFLAGVDEVEAWVGSGNIEAGGLRANLEICNVVRCGRDGDGEHGSLVGQVWRYIRRDVARGASPIVLKQLEQVEAALPWLSRGTSITDGASLVTGPVQDAVEAIVAAVGKREVKRIILTAPFFDPKLSAVADLVEALKPGSVAILVQPDRVSLPGNRLRDLKGAEVFELRSDRYAHAKVLIVEARGRSVMLAGSHNVSVAAMHGKNFEAGILRIDDKESAFTIALGLAPDLVASNRVSEKELANIKLRLRDNRLPGNIKSILVGAELDGDGLIVFAAKPSEKAARLVPYADGKELKSLDLPTRVDDREIRFSVKGVDASRWTAVALDFGDTMSAPVALTRPNEIEQRFKPRVRPPKAVEEGRPDELTLPDVEEVIEQFAALMADEFRARRLAGHRSRGERDEASKTKSVKAMRYEDFIVSWQGVPAKDGRVGDRSDVEWVLASLVHVTGGSRAPLPVPRVEPLDKTPLLDDDSGLGDESAHLEEAMMDGKMEDRPPVKVPPKTPAGEDRPKRRRERRFAVAGRVARQLKHFSRSLPWTIYHFAEGGGDLPLSSLEGLLNAARFLTSMIGRKEKQGREELEYLPLEVWARFNVVLLHVLTARDLRFIERLPLERIEPALSRQWLARLTGYLLLVHAFLEDDEVEEDTRLCLRLGLGLAGLALGVDRKGDGGDVEEAARRIVGTIHSEVKVPPFQWEAWAGVVAALRKADTALWSEFRVGSDIRKLSKGFFRPEAGQWVWWPHMQGLAIITAVQGRNVKLMNEPECDERMVGRDYVVPVTLEP